jgi:hypothetical protein
LTAIEPMTTVNGVTRLPITQTADYRNAHQRLSPVRRRQRWYPTVMPSEQIKNTLASL